METPFQTLLLRLEGPMQSWGTQSRFAHRETDREPSKSGVVGLVCAALGRPRDESVDDLAALRFGVRVDHEGLILRDYHTARRSESSHAILSERFYLAQASFLAGFEARTPAQAELLRKMRAALEDPVWPVYLGRKACLPTVPPSFEGNLVSLPLERALLEVVPGPANHNDDPRLRLVLETDYGAKGAMIRQDQPLGAAYARRTFGLRYITVSFAEPKEEKSCSSPA